MVTGSKKATMAASEPRPGPQVPPAAGLGSPTNRPVTAKAAPNSPRLTRTILTHHKADPVFMPIRCHRCSSGSSW